MALTPEEITQLNDLIVEWESVCTRPEVSPELVEAYGTCASELRAWKIRVEAGAKTAQTFPMCTLGESGCCHEKDEPRCGCPCHTQPRAMGALPPPAHAGEIGMTAEEIVQSRTASKSTIARSQARKLCEKAHDLATGAVLADCKLAILALQQGDVHAAEKDLMNAWSTAHSTGVAWKRSVAKGVLGSTPTDLREALDAALVAVRGLSLLQVIE